jgi:peptidoglycan/LPS O-acetylase OafA/YrhL
VQKILASSSGHSPHHGFFMQRTSASPPPAGKQHLQWLDGVKALALIWIFLNHLAERIFGFPYFGNPAEDWPPIHERIAQLQPLDIDGVWGIAANLLRYVGWTGDQGVSVFLIASGFGITWGLLQRPSPRLDTVAWYRARAARIYPLWWCAHLLILFPPALIGWRISVLDNELWLSLLGVRILPEQIYYGVPAWWFISLLIQLYLVYPFLWWGLSHLGPYRLTMLAVGLGLIARAIGLFWFEDFLDAYARGAIFISRLPEFAVGIGLAIGYRAASRKTASALRQLLTVGLCLVLFAVGFALSLTLAGMIVAPLLQGLAAFGVFRAIALGWTAVQPRASRVLGFLGRHSYSIYLVHQAVLMLLIPLETEGVTPALMRRTVVVGILAALVSLGVALFFERLVSFAASVLRKGTTSYGLLGLTLRIGGVVGVLWAVCIAAELRLRRVAPQEPPDLGWGERASLEPHDEFSYRLKPSQETRLRWESYDYTVRANQLGFPGPCYATTRSAETYRILTTGDAFTSAEGLDTEHAWPRVLESCLRERLGGRPVQVMNLAVTGYGPNQYAAVIEHFTPIYQPDLVLIGFFVNDYDDAMLTDAEFHESIGFSLPPPNGLRGILSCRHLTHYLRKQAIKTAYESVLGKPDPVGYFFGQFSALRRSHGEAPDESDARVRDKLAHMGRCTRRHGARMAIAMIPSAPQVCEPDDLAYYPRHVDLHDRSQFDLDLPQRKTREIAGDLGIPHFDLRPILRDSPQSCPYQAHNMHWTIHGHRAVAEYLADRLIKDGYLSRQSE